MGRVHDGADPGRPTYFPSVPPALVDDAADLTCLQALAEDGPIRVAATRVMAKAFEKEMRSMAAHKISARSLMRVHLGRATDRGEISPSHRVLAGLLHELETVAGHELQL